MPLAGPWLQNWCRTEIHVNLRSRVGGGGGGGTEAADGEAAQKRVPLGGGVSGLDMGSSPLGSHGLPLPAICLGKPPEDKRQGELHSRQN